MGYTAITTCTLKPLCGRSNLLRGAGKVCSTSVKRQTCLCFRLEAWLLWCFYSLPPKFHQGPFTFAFFYVVILLVRILCRSAFVAGISLIQLSNQFLGFSAGSDKDRPIPRNREELDAFVWLANLFTQQLSWPIHSRNGPIGAWYLSLCKSCPWVLALTALLMNQIIAAERYT